MSFGFMESTLYHIVNYQIVKSLLDLNATWIIWLFVKFSTWLPTESSVQFSSVAQSCPTLCDPMNRSTPGLPVTNHLLTMKTQKSQLDVTRWAEACLTEPCCPQWWRNQGNARCSGPPPAALQWILHTHLANTEILTCFQVKLISCHSIPMLLKWSISNNQKIQRFARFISQKIHLEFHNAQFRS